MKMGMISKKDVLYAFYDEFQAELNKAKEKCREVCIQDAVRHLLALQQTQGIVTEKELNQSLTQLAMEIEQLYKR